MPSSIRLFLTIFLNLPVMALACSGSLHIELKDPGIYALDYAAITTQQPSLGDCRNSDLILRNHGREVPLRVFSNTDLFSNGDRIEWVGEHLAGPESWFNAYSTANVYLLSAEPGTHARIQKIAPPDSVGTPATLVRTLHLEQENLMIRLNQSLMKPGDQPDVWYWAKLTHADPEAFSFQFDLPDVDLRDLAHRNRGANAVIAFRGISDVPEQQGQEKPTDHQVEIALNGTPMPTLNWDGRDEMHTTLALPLALLKNSGNSLSLRVPKRYMGADNTQNPLVDVAMFNYIELTFPITGKLDANSASFSVANDMPSMVLSYSSADTPVLYSADGYYLTGKAHNKDQWHFAAGPKGVALYPVTDEHRLQPTSLRPVATTNWHQGTPGYDYLIVSHPRLIQAMVPLAEFHRQRGLHVALINVNDVYDQFNHGITHPQAIRNLVTWGTTHWQVKPRYLLLAGDASFDIHHDNEPLDNARYAKWVNRGLLKPGQFNHMAATPYSDTPKDLPNRNLIPTWQYPSMEGQSASDNGYAALNAGDYHPTLAVGRFPVVEPEEIKAIVDKTIAYMNKPQVGAWRRDVMFITDESELFKQASDQIASALGQQGFSSEKVYASPKEKDNLAHKSAIKDGLNQGQLLVHFIGHGGRFIWRTGPPDLKKNHDLFTLDDVSTLANGDRLPMILSMTCYSAPFDNPSEDSIGERFLRESSKGAIAVFAASWRNSPSTAFSKKLIDELLQPGASIGEAIVRAKKTLHDRDSVEMYNLLGDPAVVLERPRDTLKLSADGNRWSPGALVELPSVDFHGEISVDWLDIHGKILVSQAYHADEARFHLRPPALPNATLAEVHIYSINHNTGHDGIGALDLRAKPTTQWSLSSWLYKMRKRQPLAPDTLMRAEFEGDDVPVATSRTMGQ